MVESSREGINVPSRRQLVKNEIICSSDSNGVSHFANILPPNLINQYIIRILTTRMSTFASRTNVRLAHQRRTGIMHLKPCWQRPTNPFYPHELSLCLSVCTCTFIYLWERNHQWPEWHTQWRVRYRLTRAKHVNTHTHARFFKIETTRYSRAPTYIFIIHNVQIETSMSSHNNVTLKCLMNFVVLINLLSCWHPLFC